MVKRETLIWIRAAKDDLVDAKLAYENKRWFRTAFYAQQAVEKALKVLFFLVRRGEQPKINSVTELYNMLREKGFNLPEETEKQICILNKYYTVTRYPDAANGLPSESVDRIESERALSIAEEVVQIAKKYIGERN
ncbi:MAG: HEPN domain-containing protein [Candidatus Njordarchaeia archaeon]